MKLIINISLALSCYFTANCQTFKWVKTFGGLNSEVGNSIQIDASGNIITVGTFNDTADFDPGTGISDLASNGNSDIFVQKIDASGNLIWAKSFGGTSTDEVLSHYVDASGNIYTTGYYRGTVDFDPGIGVTTIKANFFDAYIQKMDPSGNLIWVKTLGGLGSKAVGRSICVDALSNVFITGYFDGTIDFDPGTKINNITSAGQNDGFIEKLDATGNLVWVKSFGNTDHDAGHSIRLDAAGNIYTSGYFKGTVDFGPKKGGTNLKSKNSGVDFFIQKMNPEGNLVWVKSFGGNGSDYCEAISIDNQGNVYTTGFYNQTTEIDPRLGIPTVTSSKSGTFVQKISASGDLLWAKSLGGQMCKSISVDTKGNVYTTGEFFVTVDFDPGEGIANLSTGVQNYSDADVFIHKMDAAGNFVWVQSIGGTGGQESKSITVDGNGNVYTTGRFFKTTDFDSGTTIQECDPKGYYDVFVHKLSQ